MDQIDRLQEFVKRSGYLPRVADPTVPLTCSSGASSLSIDIRSSFRANRDRRSTAARRPVMPLPLILAFFAGGLVVGSFLNVCIHRLPLHESIVWPASHCTTCDRQLAWYENIPVASWLVLRGRCRTCGQPISWRYPLVELVTGAVFAGGLVVYGPTPLLVVRLAFACALIVLFAIDLQHQILPNLITLPGVVIGFVASLFLPPGWLSSAIGILAGGGSLLAIAEGYRRVRGQEGLGMGDVKMLAMIGAFLGWR
jgi:leader peptidase (prepilin peptidase)/N-methyltransferase